QHCFDIQAKEATVRGRLLRGRVPRSAVNACLRFVPRNAPVRIEVKSKRARTPHGEANVIHCSDHKLRGKRHHEPATHFAVILFSEDGIAEGAWLFPSKVAARLRTDTKSKYIP